MTPAQLIEQVWATMESVNADAPSHSHISKNMIVCMPHGTVFPKSAKGSVQRPAAYAQFKEVRILIVIYVKSLERDMRILNCSYLIFREQDVSRIRKFFVSGKIWREIDFIQVIDKAYEDYEKGGEKIRRKVESEEQVVQIIREKVTCDFGGKKVDDDADLFALGVNSVQASRIRNSIQSVRNSKFHPISSRDPRRSILAAKNCRQMSYTKIRVFDNYRVISGRF